MPLPAQSKPSSLPRRAEDTDKTQHGDKDGQERGPSTPQRGVRPGQQTSEKHLPHPMQKAHVGTAGWLWGRWGAPQTRAVHPGTRSSLNQGWAVLRCGKRQVWKQEANSSLYPRPTGGLGVHRATRHAPAVEGHPARRATGPRHWRAGMVSSSCCVTWRDQRPFSEMGQSGHLGARPSQLNLFWPSSR